MAFTLALLTEQIAFSLHIYSGKGMGASTGGGAGAPHPDSQIYSYFLWPRTGLHSSYLGISHAPTLSPLPPYNQTLCSPLKGSYQAREIFTSDLQVWSFVRGNELWFYIRIALCYTILHCNCCYRRKFLISWNIFPPNISIVHPYQKKSGNYVNTDNNCNLTAKNTWQTLKIIEINTIVRSDDRTTKVRVPPSS